MRWLDLVTWLALVTWMALAIAAWPSRTRAQDAPRIVEVSVAGDTDTASALEDVIRELVSHLPVAIVWFTRPAIRADEVLAPRGAEEQVIARVWLDLTSTERALIYIANTGNDRFLVRSLPLTDAYDEVARESLGQIVESTIGALWAGGEIGVSRDDAVRVVEREIGPIAPPPAPAPPPIEEAVPSPPVETAPRGPSIALALLYRAELFDDGPVVRHAPELGLALGLTGADLDVLLYVGAQYHAPLELRGEPAGALFDGGGLRLALGVAYRILPFVTWRAAIGGGVDLAWVRPVAYPWAHVEASAPFFLAAPIATFFSTLEVIVLGPLALYFGASLDADLAGNHFVVETRETTARVIDPWAVRVVFLAGVAFVLDR